MYLYKNQPVLQYSPKRRGSTKSGGSHQKNNANHHGGKIELSKCQYFNDSIILKISVFQRFIQSKFQTVWKRHIVHTEDATRWWLTG